MTLSAVALVRVALIYGGCMGKLKVHGGFFWVPDGWAAYSNNFDTNISSLRLSIQDLIEGLDTGIFNPIRIPACIEESPSYNQNMIHNCVFMERPKWFQLKKWWNAWKYFLSLPH